MIARKKLVIANLIPLIVFIFAFIFNQYFGNRGVFPIDSFSHLDTGFRVLNGEHPFRDYWTVSGPLIDYLQGFLFLIFEVNWQTYLFHASIINAIISLATYKILIAFNLNKSFSFFYTICFCILAYPSSGTPFVDHHSTFLSILAIYCFIIGMKNNNKVCWILVPILIVLAFLSKQVPSAYIFLSIIFILNYHFFFNNKSENIAIIKNLFFSSLIIIILLAAFINFNNINFFSFMDQYLNFPQEIAQKRYEKLSYNFKNIFLDFKFIYFVFFILLFLNIYKLIKIKKFYQKINFKIFLILSLLFISLIHHQILTKNQIYIFFLIPLLAAFAHIELLNFKNKNKKIFIFLLFLICLFTTYKYHHRFNVERKFHEFKNIEILNSVNAKVISKEFSGLRWLTPNKKNKEEVLNEIESIDQIKLILKQDAENKMLITNYSIFSVLINKSLNSPSRWYPGNDSALPNKNSKFYNNYKNFLIFNIKSKKIKNIYLVSDVDEKNFLNYIEDECFNRKEINKSLIKYEINENCPELSGK